ncbi:MAG TPA: branched-chain-amino-acid transaminase [Spirochaetota bacterium]|nr:branched-chain-amino-acid transaminase [Spirochaetota bacterium]HOM38020.1 branched-chain-amino-acid transaminase [Spirochaetota bacterium]HPQ48824.1 branched-chain-amino-acid transaminase [Spirochaetota bacterium]
MKIYINGNFYTKDEAKISVFDHGFLYGDGVFEGIRIYNGRVFKLKEHIDRLYDSAKAIMLNIPMSKEELIKATLITCKENNLYDGGYIRLVVSRGDGDLGLNPYNCKKANVVIIAATIKLYPEEFYEKGLKIITVPTRRNLPEALSPSIKSLNYLNNVMAKIEAINAGVEEALMINQEGYVSECTGDNIFIVKNNTLITPPSYMGILVGITRNSVMEIAEKDGIKVEERVLTRYDVYTSDECFLTGSAAEIIPVVEIDRRSIGNGFVGKITKRLIKLFREYVKTNGEIIPE